VANINSISGNSSNSYSSLYNSSNTITGLASGMDTESMIENAVSGYQTKITQLQQSQTKIEWKQEAYRELIDQMYSISNKYTSYTSATNLSSNSFFTNNVTTTASGTYASAVTATGKATSDIQINAVTQLAAAARYAVDAGSLGVKTNNEAVGGAIDWGKSVTKGTLSGTMTLKLGGSSIDIRFTDDDKYENLNELVNGINEKLKAQNADVQATLSGGEIKFGVTGDAKTKGDSVYISGASGNLKTMLNVTTATSSADENRFNYTSFSLKGSESDLTKTMSMTEFLSGKTIDVTLDGTTKSIKIGDLTGIASPDLSAYDTKIAEINAKFDEVKNTEMSDEERAQKNAELREELRAAQLERSNALSTAMIPSLQADLQATLNKEFGANRVTVSTTNDGGLRFDVAEGSGSTLRITSSVGEELGLGEAGVSNYFNTSQKLGDLLGTSWLDANARVEGTLDTNAAVRYFDKDGNELTLSDGVYYRTNSDGSIMSKDGQNVLGTPANTLYTDVEGNLIKKYANEDTYYRVNEKGEWLYDLKINGASIGDITKDTALESVLNKINSSSEAGVKVSYSNLTSQFVFTANETGEGGKISFDNALAKKLFEAQPSTLSDVFGAGRHDIKIVAGAAQITLASMSADTDIGNLMNSIRGLADDATVSVTNEDGTARSFTAAQLKAYASGAATLSAADSVGYTKGQDAIMKATVNGKELTLKRSSNVIGMDGLTVTLKEEFSAYDETTGKVKAGDAVTFATHSDADKITDAIKSFVEDVNKLMTGIHEAYTTQPIRKTSSSSKKGTTYYEPLSEDDKNDMSESAVEKYEEKAKTGLLFGDNDLRSLYDKLLSVIQSSGTDRTDMESIGLSTTYSGGVTTLQLNEAALRAALDSDPDKVRNVFTKTSGSGSKTEGLMSGLKTQLNNYASTSITSPGVLVRKAGTKLSSLSLINNNLQTQLDMLSKQIESWQTKLSNKVDYYTKQFTQLEKLMSSYNNQSSMLADMMGN